MGIASDASSGRGAANTGGSGDLGAENSEKLREQIQDDNARNEEARNTAHTENLNKVGAPGYRYDGPSDYNQFMVTNSTFVPDADRPPPTPTARRSNYGSAGK